MMRSGVGPRFIKDAGGGLEQQDGRNVGQTCMRKPSNPMGASLLHDKSTYFFHFTWAPFLRLGHFNSDLLGCSNGLSLSLEATLDAAKAPGIGVGKPT